MATPGKYQKSLVPKTINQLNSLPDAITLAVSVSSIRSQLTVSQTSISYYLRIVSRAFACKQDMVGVGDPITLMDSDPLITFIK